MLSLWAEFLFYFLIYARRNHALYVATELGGFLYYR